MQAKVIASLIMLTLLAVFVLQNTDPVTIRFFLLSYSNIQLVLVILFSVLFGALLIAVLQFPSFFRLRAELKKLQARIRELEHQLNDQSDDGSDLG